MLNFIIREYQNTLRYRLTAIKVNLYFVNFFLFLKVVYLFLVFTAACGFSLVVGAEAALQLWCMGFQSLWLPFLQNSGSMSSGSVAVAHWAQLPHCMWELLGLGTESLSPTLADRFFTTELPEKPLKKKKKKLISNSLEYDSF